MHVDGALAQGRRGLPGGSSLAHLLARHRKVRKTNRQRSIGLQQILNWADAHHARYGKWPTAHSGSVPHAPGETWYRVQMALKQGRRGLAGGSSIAALLLEHRGVRSKANLKRITKKQILRWADAYYKRTGKWPTRDSGATDSRDETTWMAVQDALYLGGRGLPGGCSLAQLLQENRGARNIQRLPELTTTQILEWADAHYERHGKWPIRESGALREVADENWGSVDHALKVGSRGLTGGTTLAQLLAKKRGKRNLRDLPTLSGKLIVRWAEAHYKRFGRWPSQTSGLILDAPGEKWRNVDTALYKGLRGLPGGSSLADLLRDQKRRAKAAAR